MVPVGTPAPIVAKLHAAVVMALNDKDVRSKLLALGVVPNGNTPDEFKADLVRSYSKMADIIKAAGIKVE